MKLASEVSVRQAASMILSECDGAVEEDGVGFNKFDARFIRDIIELEDWSDKQKRAVYDVIVKYKDQLEERHDTLLDEVEEPPTEAEINENQQKIMFYRTGKPVAVEFQYGCDKFNQIKDFFKELDFTFQKKGKWSDGRWVYFNPGKEIKKQIKGFIKKYEDRVVLQDGLFEDMDVEESSSENSDSNSDVVVYRENGEIVFDIEYKCDNFYDIKDAVKNHGGRFNEYDNNNWVVQNSLVSIYENLRHYNNQIDWGDLEEEVKEKQESNDEFKKLSGKQLAGYEHPEGFHGELFGHQQAVAEYVSGKYEEGQGTTLRTGFMGAGKAQPLDEKVLTPDGWELMGNIKSGDYVIGQDGKKTEVVEVYPQGTEEVYEVTFSDGSSTKVSKNHLWTVRSPAMKNQELGWQVKSTKELIGDLEDISGNKKWFIPMVNPVCFQESDVSIPPYLLGILLGDGSVSVEGRVKFSSGDEEIVNNVKSVVENHYDNLSVNKVSKYDYNIIDKRNRKNILINQLKDLDVFGRKSFEKFIPNEYKKASVEARKKLLQGILDSDGSVDGSAIVFSSSSEKLSDDVRDIIYSLGGSCSKHVSDSFYNYRGEKKQGLDRYRLYARLPGSVNPFTLSRKSVKNPQERIPTRSISSIEYVGKEETKCIAVRDTKQLYVTKDYIVTHNTIETLFAIEDHKEFPALLVVPASVKYHWKEKAEKFLPLRSIEVLEGHEGDIDTDKDIYVCNYDILYKRVEDLKEVDFNTIALDESHYIKSPTAKRTKSVMELDEYHEPNLKLALSGTPFKNQPSELIKQLEFLEVLDHFGGYKNFIKRYCGGSYQVIISCKDPKFSKVKKALNNAGASFNPDENQYSLHPDRVGQFYNSLPDTIDTQNDLITFWFKDGAENIDELHDKLKELCMIRHKRSDTFDNMKKREREFVALPYNEKEYEKAEEGIANNLQVERQKKISGMQKKMDKMVEEFAETGDENLKEKISELAKKIENKQRSSGVELNKINELRQKVLDLKLEHSIEWIENALQSEEKLIVFAYHKKAIQGIYEEFEDIAVKVDGDTKNATEKQNEFQENDDVKLFVGQTEAAGEGLTLTESYVVAFVEFPWTPTGVDQCESRAYMRMNDPHGITSYFLYLPNTIDEYILDLLDKKWKVFKKVIDNEDVGNVFKESVEEVSALSSVEKNIIAGHAKEAEEI